MIYWRIHANTPLIVKIQKRHINAIWDYYMYSSLRCNAKRKPESGSKIISRRPLLRSPKTNKKCYSAHYHNYCYHDMLYSDSMRCKRGSGNSLRQQLVMQDMCTMTWLQIVDGYLRVIISTWSLSPSGSYWYSYTHCHWARSFSTW